MSRLDRALGRRRDLPQIEAITFAAIATGNAADPAVDTVVTVVPQIASAVNPFGTPFGMTSALPNNSMVARCIQFVAQAAATTLGNATNNCYLKVNIYRAGVLQGILAYLPLSVATTLGTAVVTANLAGPFAVTPPSMVGIVPGLELIIDAGASLEVVRVLSVTATTFTALFTLTHASGATVNTGLIPFRPTNLLALAGISTTLPAITLNASPQFVTPNAPTNGTLAMAGIRVGDYLLVDTVASGAQETVQVTAVSATQFSAIFAKNHLINAPVVSYVGPNPPASNEPFELRAGDVLTLNRVSNNVTGLATPIFLASVEWVPSKLLQ